MKVSVYLAVAQWALLLALGLLVIIAYRQFGRVFGRDQPDMKFGPAVGSKASSFEYTRVADDTVQYVTPGNERPMLIAFVDPICPACEKLVTVLGEATDAGELAALRVLLLTSQSPSLLQVSDAFRATGLEIGWVSGEQARDDYGALATPLLVAIDATGAVRAAGPVIDRKNVGGFSRACLQAAPDVTAGPIVSGTPSRDPNPDTAGAAAVSELMKER
jgi:hypothetical protein